MWSARDARTKLVDRFFISLDTPGREALPVGQIDLRGHAGPRRLWPLMARTAASASQLITARPVIVIQPDGASWSEPSRGAKAYDRRRRGTRRHRRYQFGVAGSRSVPESACHCRAVPANKVRDISERNLPRFGAIKGRLSEHLGQECLGPIVRGAGQNFPR